MPIISSPVGTLLVAAVVVVSLVLWLVRDRRYPGPRLHAEDDGIDREELEEAEREIRDLNASQRPEEGFESDDWGPGVPSRRAPPGA